MSETLNFVTKERLFQIGFYIDMYMYCIAAEFYVVFLTIIFEQKHLCYLIAKNLGLNKVKFSV